MPPADFGFVGHTLQAADALASVGLSYRASPLSYRNSIHNFITSKPILITSV